MPKEFATYAVLISDNRKRFLLRTVGRPVEGQKIEVGYGRNQEKRKVMTVGKIVANAGNMYISTIGA